MKEPSWRNHLPAVLILGSPIIAAGMMLIVALTDVFLLSETTLMRIGVTLIVPINFALACLGAAMGTLRVGGNVSTRIAVLIVSVGFGSTGFDTGVPARASDGSATIIATASKTDSNLKVFIESRSS